MGKAVMKVFGRIFLKTLLIIISYALALSLAFCGTRYFYQKKAEKQSEEDAKALIDGAATDTVSKNLIFVHNESKNTISAVVLEIFDTENNTMKYVTIPTDGDITIPPAMYEKISAINDEIPQVFPLKKLTKYFDKNDMDAYGYGALIVEAYFNIDVSYYSVVSKDVFEQAFTANTVSVDSDGKIQGFNYSAVGTTTTVTSETDTSDTAAEASATDPYESDDSYVTANHYENEESTDTTDSTTTDATETTDSTVDSTLSGDTSTTTTVVQRDVYELNAEYMSQFADMDESSLSDKITEICDDVESNLAVTDKVGYVDSYLNLDNTTICYYCVPGYTVDEVYYFDADVDTQFFRDLGVDAFPNATTSSDDEDSSDDEASEIPSISNLVILNASRVQGMAAAWSEKLTLEGYNVTEVGNYDTEQLQDSKIIVGTEGMGEELKAYFSNATIEVGEVPDGADAEIIIGVNDANLNQ